MAHKSLKNLGRLVIEKRDTRKIRETATEIGISAATLSRVENGHLPDLENFTLICKWLGEDPAKLLGLGSNQGAKPKQPVAHVHFRKDNAIKLETAQSLANMIISAQRSIMAQEKLEQ